MWETAERIIFTDDEDTIAYFTEGQCGALAYEIHKLTGFSLGLISSLPVGSEDYMGHLFVFNPDGLVIDIRGVRTLEDVKDEWYFCPYIYRFFSLKEFEYEMVDWQMGTRYDRDKNAQHWAKYIVNVIND
jgi:hypothetical protein